MLSLLGLTHDLIVQPKENKILNDNFFFFFFFRVRQDDAVGKDVKEIGTLKTYSYIVWSESH